MSYGKKGNQNDISVYDAKDLVIRAIVFIVCHIRWPTTLRAIHCGNLFILN